MPRNIFIPAFSRPGTTTTGTWSTMTLRAAILTRNRNPKSTSTSTTLKKSLKNPKRSYQSSTEKNWGESGENFKPENGYLFSMRTRTTDMSQSTRTITRKIERLFTWKRIKAELQNEKTLTHWKTSLQQILRTRTFQQNLGTKVGALSWNSNSKIIKSKIIEQFEQKTHK